MSTDFSQILWLIAGLTKRDIATRFRGSLLGALWLVINPLFLLSLYYYVFSFILNIRWQTVMPDGRTVEQSGTLSLFAGLIAYTFFSECLIRAPGLMRENVSYIKKVVFPLAVLPVVATLSALFSAGVNFCLLLIFYVFSVGMPPWEVIAFPFFFLLLALGTLGVVFGMSALGMYLPDLKAVVGPVATAFMFMTPIMYPASMVPESVRAIVRYNPLAIVVEGLRASLFNVAWPGVHEILLLGAICAALAALGVFGFMKLRKGFADVI